MFQYWVSAKTPPTYADEWARIVDREEVNEFILKDLAGTLLKSYMLADRLPGHKLRRHLNNASVKYSLMFFTDHELAVAAVAYAFDNISSERPILQFLVDDFCEHTRTDRESGQLLPVYKKWLGHMLPAFAKRVKRRLENVVARPKSDFCYLEHLKRTAICDR